MLESEVMNIETYAVCLHFMWPLNALGETNGFYGVVKYLNHKFENLNKLP